VIRQVKITHKPPSSVPGARAFYSAGEKEEMDAIFELLKIMVGLLVLVGIIRYWMNGLPPRGKGRWRRVLSDREQRDNPGNHPRETWKRVRHLSGPTRTGISTRQDDQERPLPDRSGMRASQGLKNRLSDVQADKRLLHSCKDNLAEQSLESPCL